MLPKITFFFFFGKTSQKVSESVLLQKQHTGVKRQFSDLAAEEDHMCEAKQTGKPSRESEMLLNAHSSCFADSSSEAHTSRRT